VVRCQRVPAVPIPIPNCLPQWTDKVLDCMCGSVLNRATMCNDNEMRAASKCDTDTSRNFQMYRQNHCGLMSGVLVAFAKDPMACDLSAFLILKQRSHVALFYFIFV